MENAKAKRDAENAKAKQDAEDAKAKQDAEDAKVKQDAENAKVQQEAEDATFRSAFGIKYNYMLSDDGDTAAVDAPTSGRPGPRGSARRHGRRPSS